MVNYWCFLGFHRWREEFRWVVDGYKWLWFCAACGKVKEAR